MRGVLARLLCASLAGLFVLLLLTSCAERPAEKLTLHPVAYADLPGWTEDRVGEALPALNRSCRVLSKKPAEASLGIAGKAKDWQAFCAALKLAAPQDDTEAREFLESWLQPYSVEQKGLFTGYYEAELNGAWQQGGIYQTPLWQRPGDLIAVDLGAFKPELKGQRIAGKVVGQKLLPYDDRAAVARNGLAGRAEPLLWVDDPVQAFFLEIQGSGRVRFADGQVQRIGYDAQNGHAYVPIGRVLAEDGEIAKPVTMAKIRAWLAAHPERAQAMMNRNPSVVFFRKTDDGPIGAQGVTLTPQRSLAVDPAFMPLGVPLWLAADTLTPRLVVAQDTGGAIKGAVRGDLFCGAGPEAEAQAGALQAGGTYYVLLPRTMDVAEK